MKLLPLGEPWGRPTCKGRQKKNQRRKFRRISWQTEFLGRRVSWKWGFKDDKKNVDFKEEASCCDLFSLYNHLVGSFPFLLLSLLEWSHELGCAAVSTISHQCRTTSLPHISTVLHQYHITSVLHHIGTVPHQYCITSVLYHISAASYRYRTTSELHHIGTIPHQYCITLVLCHQHCITSVLYHISAASHWYHILSVPHHIGTILHQYYITLHLYSSTPCN